METGKLNKKPLEASVCTLLCFPIQSANRREALGRVQRREEMGCRQNEKRIHLHRAAPAHFDGLVVSALTTVSPAVGRRRTLPPLQTTNTIVFPSEFGLQSTSTLRLTETHGVLMALRCLSMKEEKEPGRKDG